MTATTKKPTSATGAAKGKGKPKAKLTVRDLPGTPSDVPQKHAGGRPPKYKPEYAERAYQLCATSGYTDRMLAEEFGVNELTIRRWRADHPEFCTACRVGKAETDNLVERHAIAHIGGYYVEVDELDKFGVVHRLQKWIPGNAHAAMKWLSSRRPEVYREQTNTKHTLSMDDAFLRFLDHLEAKHEGAGDSQSPKQQLQVIDVEAVEVSDTKQ